MVAGETVDDDATTHEVAPLTAVPVPIGPSAADVEYQHITHTPCCSWCDSCVEGRGFSELRGRHVGRIHAPGVIFTTVEGVVIPAGLLGEALASVSHNAAANYRRNARLYVA